MLVHVVEYDVELLFALRQNFERIANMDLDAIRDARLLEVAARFVGILAAAIGVMDRATFTHRLGPPDGGIADG